MNKGQKHNVNCLENMECPACGQRDRFHIDADAMAEVVDNGVDDYGDELTWNEDSYCYCHDCEEYGTVGYFTAFFNKEGKRI